MSKTHGNNAFKTEVEVNKAEVKNETKPTDSLASSASSEWVLAGNLPEVTWNRSCSDCQAKNAAQARHCMMCGSTLDVAMSERKRSVPEQEGSDISEANEVTD